MASNTNQVTDMNQIFKSVFDFRPSPLKVPAKIFRFGSVARESSVTGKNP